MAENKKSIVLYVDLIHTIKKLVEKDRTNKTNNAGELFLHLLEYTNDLNPTPINDVVELVFEPIKQTLKRDLIKWEDGAPERAEKAKKAGLASGIARELKRTQTNSQVKNELNPTQRTVSVSVSVPVSEPVIVKKEKPIGVIAEAKKASAEPKLVNDNFDSKEKTASTEIINAEPTKKISTYTGCIEAYNNFMLKRTGLPGKFDGAEGKAMKTIIAYLEPISHDKTPQGVINSFAHILSLVDQWDPFHKGQLKLIQINSNLINIINSIKNGNTKQSANAYDNKYRTPSNSSRV